jgi:hypothetical protein
MPIRLNLMPFLQEWTGGNLQLRLLVIPRGNPLNAMLPGQPAFADIDFVFDVRVTPGLSTLPTTTSATATFTLPAPARPQARVLFESLAAQFDIDPTPPPATPRRAATQVKKYAPVSYREAAQFTGARTPFVVSDDSYYCIVNKRREYQHQPPHDPKVPWGRVIAIALRQPMLAEALGLIVPLTVPIAPANLLSSGGWIHVAPSPASGISFAAEPDALKIYASRSPLLAAARPLFTPVLFPVAAVPPPVPYDELFQEAVSYDDGFAKIVHGAQPRQFEPLKETDDGSRPHHEAGVRLGWDDEQITVWLNRQIDPAAAVLDAPMGASSYRVDARLAGEATWHSLCRATSAVKVGAVVVGNFDGEYGVQTHPMQLENERTGDFWLPSYYVSWLGPSLVARDQTAHDLIGIAPTNPDTVTGVAPDIALRYGKPYEFRVRMVDQTGGGPQLTDSAANLGPAPTTTVHFRRWIRPKKVKVDAFVGETPPSLTIRRPRLGYPEYGFTGASVDPDAALRADIPAANSEKREVSLPDPDVTSVSLTVEVQTLKFDPIGGNEQFETVYTTTRSFPTDPTAPLTLDLDWVDTHSISTMVAPDSGPITVPTARQVRLQIQPLCREDLHNDYFGAADVRNGPAAVVAIRKESSDEREMFLGSLPSDALRALYLQPDLPEDANVASAQRIIGAGRQAPADVPTRIAAELRLVVDGLSLRTHAGRRVLFGASPTLRHVLGPDHSSITFCSKNELVGHWIVVLQASIARDWTWDGLSTDGIAIERDGNPMGSVEPTRSISADALVDANREQTDIIYFDVVDPQPDGAGFPIEQNLSYSLTAKPTNPAATLDPTNAEAIVLPITTPPTQRPKLVSAGIALSPYQRNADYSQTQPRERALWLEFDRPPDNPRDRYFVRLLKYAPDPLLVGPEFDQPESLEPPLPIDPELIRAIVPGQSDDRAGLDAMVQLVPSASPVHFLVPLPPGIHEDSPRLFGFFTYELRVGHVERWSTAQGRYGVALRVTGVQHPAPGLNCTIGRDSKGITASAPYANPILDDRSIQSLPPRTDMWFLLYAQVMQADGADHRNVLLSRRRGQFQRPHEKRIPAGVAFGAVFWSENEILTELAALGLLPDSPLSCLAVEMLPNGVLVADGLGSQLGEQRILRSSPLSPVLAFCECC